MNKIPEKDFTRLASLDILRGFDLFLLVFFQPVFAALARQLNLLFCTLMEVARTFRLLSLSIKLHNYNITYSQSCGFVF